MVVAGGPVARGVSRRSVVLLCVASAVAGAAGMATIRPLLGGKQREHSWGELAAGLLPMEPAAWPALAEPCEVALAKLNQPLPDTPLLAGFAWSESGVTTSESLSAARRAFEDRIAEEFGRGRVVIVDRWVLSETQAAVCALAARSGTGRT